VPAPPDKTIWVIIGVIKDSIRLIMLATEYRLVFMDFCKTVRRSKRFTDKCHTSSHKALQNDWQHSRSREKLSA
jgi:hypothetical protein